MNIFNTFLYGEKYPIIKWKEDEEIEFWLKAKYKYQECPTCGKRSYKIHDIHKRRIQDTPIHNKKVYININVREFKCENKKCNQKTFTEELSFVGKNQVRTYALTEFILFHSIYMSSNSTSLILSFIGVEISPDTIDNILKNIDIKDNPDVEKIGIDDVALRKGIKYATAIYDLENHHLIALLEGREKDDIVPWLKNHPKITVVARDRASAYAEAINEVLPNATQVADRFHLFENLLKYLKDMFYKEIPDKIVIKEGKILDKKAQKIIKELANIDEKKLNSFNYDNSSPRDENGNIIDFIKIHHNLKSNISKKQEENRLKKYETIKLMMQDYKKNKLSVIKLSEKYGFSVTAIYSYLKLSDNEIEKIKERRIYNIKENKMSEYYNIMYKMLRDGISIDYIFAYIKKLGYKGKDMTLRAYISNLADNNNLGNIKLNIFDKYDYPHDEIVITRYDIFKYILTIRGDIKSKKIENNFNIIIEKYPIVKKVEKIFKDFHSIIFGKQEELLDNFISLYEIDISPFCKGLKKDIAAVKNAISQSINSGFVEGNNNKFKLIKRIVYGKQKLVNLFKRCYLAFTSTLDDLSLLKSVIDSISAK